MRFLNGLGVDAAAWLRPRARACPGILVGIGLFFLLEANARQALIPHVKIISWLFGCEFVYSPAAGYVARGPGFVITPSCMGARLFLAVFLLLLLGFPPGGSPLRRLGRETLYLAIALAVALVVNVARIALSIPLLPLENAQLIHNVLSLILYFSSALFVYHIAAKVHTKEAAQ